MKELAKKTAAAALAGVMTAGLLAGCGKEETKLDGTKTVATVDGVEIPMGVVSLMARQQQAYTEAMYASFFGGSTGNIWDTEADSETGETYGDQTAKDSLEQVELMYILKEKAADYNVEVTEDDQKAIAEAAAQFMEDNSEETIEALAVTEDDVKTFLELQTYQERMYNVIIADVDTEVSDEEAQQSGFTYVKVSTDAGEDEEELTEEELAKKKDQAQEILDAMKEDPEADMDEVASGIDDTLSALTGSFTYYVNEEEDEETSSSTYPDEVLEVLRGLEDGEMCEDVIETDAGYYVVRMDQVYDEEATESEIESIISNRESDLYSDTTEQWKEEADITVDDKVLAALKITDSHSFTFASTEEVTEDEVQTEGEIDAEAEEDMEEEAVEETEAEEAEETPAEEVTETPEAEPTATPTTKPTSTPTAKPTSTAAPTPTENPETTPTKAAK